MNYICSKIDCRYNARTTHVPTGVPVCGVHRRVDVSKLPPPEYFKAQGISPSSVIAATSSGKMQERWADWRDVDDAPLSVIKVTKVGPRSGRLVCPTCGRDKSFKFRYCSLCHARELVRKADAR